MKNKIKIAQTRAKKINSAGFSIPVEKIEFGFQRFLAGVDQENFYLADPTQEAGGFPILEAFPADKWELLDDEGRAVRHPSRERES